MRLSVIIPSHNPEPGRLARTLDGLRAQTLAPVDWETIFVDNASSRIPPAGFFSEHAPATNFSIRSEPKLGLTSARMRGFAAAAGEYAVLVDDDNVLAPDYLAKVIGFLDSHPRVGAVGGKSLPEFAGPVPPWADEFLPLLALRDQGDATVVSNGLRPAGASRNVYPECAPIGAGMAVRRAAWNTWLDARRDDPHALSDRRGTTLTSAGDNDLVFCILHHGWEVAYFPELVLTHLIPATRLEPAYLARLNRSIQTSWIQVLTMHDACPWPPLTPLGARMRQLKAWVAHRPWQSPAARIRWQGACGHFEGRVRRSIP